MTTADTTDQEENPMTITTEIRERLTEALLSPDLTLSSGVGSADGPRCTIAEINLILTGILHDGPHPCMSEVIRRWVIRIQDAMPDTLRNAPQWRRAAIGIAGSAAGPQAESRRRDMIMDWMWAALGDEAVIAAIPATALPSWRAMLTERTYATAYAAAAATAADAAVATAAYAAATAAYVAADAAYAAATVAADAADAADDAADAADAAVATAYAATAYAATAYAADATTAYAATAYAATAYAADAYWQRRDPAGLLARLIDIR